MDTPIKIFREATARARSSLRKDRIACAIGFAATALETLLSNRFIGKEKFEAEVYLRELMNDLNRHGLVRDYFHAKKQFATPHIPYKTGNEDRLLKRLRDLEGEFLAQAEVRREAEAAERAAEKARLLDRGQKLLDQGQAPRAKGFLRRVVEGYGDEPGVAGDVGRRMFEAGLFFEAAEILEQAVERFPTDSAAHALAIRAYVKLQEYGKAESLFLKALRNFGAHPRTHLNMSRLYLEWRKYDKAYDYAKMAFEKDPGLAEAKEIMTAAGSRVFSHR